MASVPFSSIPPSTVSTRVQRSRGGGSDYERPSPAGGDNRRLEVVADGLPLFRTQRWCPQCAWIVLRAGNAQPQMGLPWPKPPFGKSAPSPNLLMVVVCAVGGRWSDEALSFLNSLANANVRDEPENFKKVVKAAWLRKWKALLACTGARALALALLERRCTPWCDGATSSAEVVRAHRYEA